MIAAIPYHQILYIPLGPLKIYIWGLFFAIAFLISSEWAARRCEKVGFSNTFFSSLTLYVLLGAVVGGRLGFVLTNLSAYHSFLDIFKVWEGGMAFHGGFFGAMLFALPLLLKEKVSFLAAADFLAPFAMLGYAIVRAGCLLIGDHIGRVTQVPWAIYYQGALRHPISFYHLVVGLAIFVYLYRLPYEGTGKHFYLMLLLYGIGRFLVEFWREEPFLYGLHLAQWVSLLLVLVGAFGLASIRGKKPKEKKGK